MGKLTGFLEYKRETAERRKIELRVLDWRELEGKLPEDKLRSQAARCMDCGIPFCHSGCPLGNLIPEWNDLVFKGRTDAAVARLHATNNFPEFTGLVCPAPCESSCVLAIREEPVSIKQIEKQIAEHADLAPRPPQTKSGRRVAVVGSGPAGLAAGQQLARAGHDVVVFERGARPGVLLRYGIPDFKLEKHRVDKRVAQMEAEGVTFRCGTDVGRDVDGLRLRREHDAVLFAVGATKPRDLSVPGRDLPGVHFAMEFLQQQNEVIGGARDAVTISAQGKHVVVVGGGDTGSDCVGTANRQGALSVTQLELMPRPPDERAPETPWPLWPLVFRVSSSHEEGADRRFAVATTHLSGEGRVQALHLRDIEWREQGGRKVPVEVAGSDRAIDADLVLLAMGFTGVEPGSALAQLGVEVAKSGAIASAGFATNVPGIFAAGDARRGQSLVVWAIWEGREAARAVDAFLRGENSDLPTSPQG